MKKILSVLLLLLFTLSAVGCASECATDPHAPPADPDDPPADPCGLSCESDADCVDPAKPICRGGYCQAPK